MPVRIQNGFAIDMVCIFSKYNLLSGLLALLDFDMSGIEQNRAIAFAINDCARIIRRRFNDVSRPLNLTQAQYRILIYVNRQPGIGQKALADLLEVRPITLTRQLDSLCEAGFAERQADPDDRRAYRLFLTAEVTPLLQQIRRLGAKVMREALAGFEPDEHTALLNALQKIRQNLADGRPE